MSIDLTPLNDLGSAQYLGFAGGLYPDGKNAPPSAYEEAGVALGVTVQPLDRDGKPSSFGMRRCREALVLHPISYVKQHLRAAFRLLSLFARRYLC